MKDIKIKHTRRGFISRVGHGTIGFAGAGLVGAPQVRAASDNTVVDFIQTSCGKDNNEGPRILVGYASVSGSTGGISEAIGKKLCEAGARVDVKLIKDVDDPSAYDAFVLGSAILAGRWLPEGVRFVARHKEILSQAPVAYFIACLALSEDSPRNRKLAQTYVKHPVRKAPKIEPVGLGTFAGAVDYEKMPKKFRPVMKRIGAKDGDHRNWEAINEWAESIAPELLKL